MIPTGFTKDTWVSAAEILPSNRAYVHHMQAYIRPPGSNWLKEAKPGEFYVPTMHKRDTNGFSIGVVGGDKQNQQNDEQPDSTSRYWQLAVYVPGIEPQNFALSDSALLIPAGSDGSNRASDRIAEAVPPFLILGHFQVTMGFGGGACRLAAGEFSLVSGAQSPLHCRRGPAFRQQTIGETAMWLRPWSAISRWVAEEKHNQTGNLALGRVSSR